jgi:hypothetical protein
MSPRFHGDLPEPDAAVAPADRFGKMFDAVAAKFKEDDLMRLGAAMVSSKKSQTDSLDSDVPAGYTFLGQFIGHDITFDAFSSLRHDQRPPDVVNLRTPKFDLDSLYGRGPAEQPYLYDKDGIRFILGRLLDNHEDVSLPRVKTELAVIGDPRNDENVIISQLHAIFLRFHNRLAEEKPHASFKTIQQLVRWHYQWIILYDFLPHIVNEETYLDVLPHVRKKSHPAAHPPKLGYYKPRDHTFLPIEFSVAAYRYGHATVREEYRLNGDNDGKNGGPIPIFGDSPATDLRGFHEFQRGWRVDWNYFFGKDPDDRKVQRARRIGPSLTPALGHLEIPGMRNMPSLAQRNLIRGLRLGLPSGQAVAKATSGHSLPAKVLGRGGKEEFSENTPLWYYILAEAQHECEGNRLGRVGGRIVMETFIGLMMQDEDSFMRKDPHWQPDVPRGSHEFGIIELIKKARTSRIP